MSSVRNDSDFETLKSLFPHVPDSTIRNHLSVFICDDRLLLISNLLIDFQEELFPLPSTSTSTSDPYDVHGMFKFDQYDSALQIETDTGQAYASVYKDAASNSSMSSNAYVVSSDVKHLPAVNEGSVHGNGNVRATMGERSITCTSAASNVVATPVKESPLPVIQTKHSPTSPTTLSPIGSKVLLGSESPKSGLKISGYGFDYKRSRKPSPLRKRNVANTTVDESDLPQVLFPKKKLYTERPNTEWNRKDVCVDELLKRFPDRLEFLELEEPKDLPNIIQEVENVKFSPSYDKTATDDDDRWQYKWYWRVTNCMNNVGKCFDAWSQDKLEQMYQIHSDNVKDVKIIVRKDKKLESFLVHFLSMTIKQQNCYWYLTRLKLRKNFEGAKKKNDSEVDVGYPNTWVQQTDNTVLFSVKEGGPEWNEVCNIFEKTLYRSQHYTVSNIQRVQNKWFWKRYELRKKLMMEKNGKSNINEKYLFHGTRLTDPASIWSGEEGFDLRFCEDGMWGKGSYFAEKSAYSVDYAHRLQNGSRQLFLANVLTGFNVELPPDRSLKMPPVRVTSTNGAGIRYNSVSGVTNGIKVYIVYELALAYPSYLITFTDSNHPR